MFKNEINFIKSVFGKDEIPLHEPKFIGNEKKYLQECIDSGFVSSVGEFVLKAERKMTEITGAKFAVATVNGTSGLHVVLHACKINQECEVITSPLTFVATANAISYAKANPVFIDVDEKTLSISAEVLLKFIKYNCKFNGEKTINKATNKHVKAVVVVHIFGLMGDIIKLKEICDQYKIILIEDCAESLGSTYRGIHSGNFGLAGIFSFNGNKIVTSGGGGMIVTNDENLAKHLKHITTTAKMPHSYEYYHDEVGFNYRLVNINAALLVAQLENLDIFLKNKRELAKIYRDYFNSSNFKFIDEFVPCRSNFWLNAIQFKNKKQRDMFLTQTNDSKIYTRPIWKLMSDLPMYKQMQNDGLKIAKELQNTVVNLPSSVRIN